MRVYYVYGDYGYNSEQELYETQSLTEALDWARRYTRWGDMGGYNCIEVAWFADDGEYITELVIRADEIDEMEEPEWDYFSD